MSGNGTAKGTGTFGLVVLWVLLFFLGLPYAGMAFMASSFACRNSRTGTILALGTLLLVFLFTGLPGALTAAAGAGVLAGASKAGLDFTAATAAAAAAAFIAFLLGILIVPRHSPWSAESMATVIRLYKSAGMSQSEINSAVDTFIRLLPSTLATWTVSGTIVASITARIICGRRHRQTGTEPAGKAWPEEKDNGQLRLGLVPAWILILCMSAYLFHVPSAVAGAALNVGIFMLVPYTIVGLAVMGRLLKHRPGVFIFFLPGIIFPPALFGSLVLIGILDTWYDFRARMAARRKGTI